LDFQDPFLVAPHCGWESATTGVESNVGLRSFGCRARTVCYVFLACRNLKKRLGLAFSWQLRR